MAAAAATEEIAHDFRPYFIVFKDGRVQRLVETDLLPPSIDPQGVSSKDVLLLPESAVSARFYLPKLDGPSKLPILVYFHGGGFCFCSAHSGIYHRHLSSLAAEANVIIVSVEYRLAPEHPLPTAYDDSWAALQWVASHSAGGPEPWLSESGDFDRITIAGDSAGGNIVHNMAMRSGRDGLGHGVKIRGAILVHVFFCGQEPIGEEVANPDKKAFGDSLWMFANPTTVGLEDPLINPMAAAAPSLLGLGCGRVLVCVAEKDFLADRGRLYYQRLRSSGWKGTVEMLESDGEDHCFHLFNPTCENAKAMTKCFVDFLN